MAELPPNPYSPFGYGSPSRLAGGGGGFRLGSIQPPSAANANASLDEIRAMLPEPLSVNERIWQNYVRPLKMTPDEMLASEPVWSAALERGAGNLQRTHAAFADIANDMFSRMGVNRYMTPETARLYMNAERARFGKGLKLVPNE